MRNDYSEVPTGMIDEAEDYSGDDDDLEAQKKDMLA